MLTVSFSVVLDNSYYLEVNAQQYWQIWSYDNQPFCTYAAPFRNLKSMNNSYVWQKLEATMQMAFIIDIAISTFFRPKESATEPHAYAPAIIP
jgi:hypothetical protein